MKKAEYLVYCTGCGKYSLQTKMKRVYVAPVGYMWLCDLCTKKYEKWMSS